MPKISHSLGLGAESPEYHATRLGLPGKLHRLFLQVEQGKISADEATRRAVRLLQNQNGDDVSQRLPTLEQNLSLEFHSLERSLPRTAGEELSIESNRLNTIATESKRMPPRSDAPHPVIAAPPGTPARRRRRGVIVRRDRKTNKIQVNRY